MKVISTDKGGPHALHPVAFGVVGGGFFVSLLTAFVGAVILLWVIRLVAPGRA